MEPLLFIIIALIIGVGCRYFLRNTPLPYTVILLIFGLCLGLMTRLGQDLLFEGTYFYSQHSLLHSLIATLNAAIKWAGKIEPNIIMFVFLPVLIFEAAFTMDVHTFKKSVGNSAILALPGIMLAILLTALLINGLGKIHIGFGDWGWMLAFAFGAVVSATDPVAVVALLKELGASKKLATLIEGESLLNDGTAIVIFFILLGMLPFGLELQTNSNTVFYEFLRVALGGVLLGFIIGGITLIWVRKVFNDALIEITLIIVAAYLTFFIAEYFLHVSGVLGLATLGLVMAGAGRTRISADVQHFLHEFWELAAFIANTLIFIIVGVVIAKRIVFTVNDFIALFLLYAGLHIIRGIVFIVFYPVMKKIGYGLEKKEAIVAWYGGLRGAISLALALLFVGEVKKINPDPELAMIADQFLFFIAGIVVLTLLINATTIKYVINALGLTKIPPVKAIMFSNTCKTLNKNTIKELEVIQKDRFMNGADWESVKEFLPQWHFARVSEKEIAEVNPLYEARRRMLEREKSSYWSQYKQGLLGSLAYTELTDSLNDLVDKNGSVPLDERIYLDSIWRIQKLLLALQNLPLLKSHTRKLLTNRLALGYDVARGFVVAQEEILKLAPGMDFNCQSVSRSNQGDEIINVITEEINSNRLKGIRYIKDVHIAYPEIAKSIETRQATRTVLNFEKANIIKLRNDGRFEDDEAEKLIMDVEKRMRKLMELPLVAKLAEPQDILRQVKWLQDVPEPVVEVVLAIAQERNHQPGQHIINLETPGQIDMLVIARGSVKVMFNNNILDLLGVGSVLGEMSVLTGVSRTASVIADTPVTALWLSSEKMRQIISTSPELEQKLWRTAGLRFAENMLGTLKPYREWSQFKLRKWLSEGQVVKTHKNQHIRFHKRVGVLVSGTATDKETFKIHQAPAVIDCVEAGFSEKSWVFISGSVIGVE